jgi:aminodeoxyfutalosine synthase
MSAATLAGTARKAAAGATISEEEARQLMATTDLVTVGMISSEARRVRVGDHVSFVRVAEISTELAAAAAASVPLPWPPAAREIRITGTPASITGAIASVRAVALSLPAAAPMTAFSLADLWSLANGDAGALRELAQAVRDAGVVAVADVPLDQFPNIEVAAAAIEIVSSVGLLALVATWEDPPHDAIASLFALHALQERTKAFRAFAPLPRQQSATQPSTGYEDVKIVAVARTVLHNIDHIQVDWTAFGPKLAQVALLFGASDLDRVAPSDDAPLGHRRAPLEEVQRNIKSAFLDPIERDARFEQVTR